MYLFWFGENEAPFTVRLFNKIQKITDVGISESWWFLNKRCAEDQLCLSWSFQDVQNVGSVGSGTYFFMIILNSYFLWYFECFLKVKFWQNWKTHHLEGLLSLKLFSAVLVYPIHFKATPDFLISDKMFIKYEFWHRLFFLPGFSFTNIYKTVKAEATSLTPFYHFHSLQRHLNISWMITAVNSSLHKASSRTRTENLWFPSARRWALSFLPLK